MDARVPRGTGAESGAASKNACGYNVRLPALSYREHLMSEAPACPLCAMQNTYQDGDQFICPDCAHEWPAITAQSEVAADAAAVVRDSNGTPLSDGDAVILIKDLKVKGSSITLKKGTKVKSIRLVSGDHDIDCKIEGASFMLKSEFLKKA
jgi:protein PhnA